MENPQLAIPYLSRRTLLSPMDFFGPKCWVMLKSESSSMPLISPHNPSRYVAPPSHLKRVLFAIRAERGARLECFA